MRRRAAELVGRSPERCGCPRSTRACASCGPRPTCSATAQFSIYDQADATRLTGYVIRDSGLDSKATPRGVQGTISLWKNELVDPAAVRRPAQHIFDRKHAEVYAEYQRRLHAAGAMDFDDLLVNTVALLRQHPDVLEAYRQRFQHVLVDEYQDTNVAQNDSSCCSPAATATSRSSATATSRSTASAGPTCATSSSSRTPFPRGSRRSSSTRTTAARRRSSMPPTPSPTTSTASSSTCGRTSDGVTGSSATGRRTRWTRRAVAATAHQLRDTDAVNWREIAVLYRTNAQSRIIEESLMRSGVPYKVVGGTRYYDRREIRDAMAYLRAVVNPADEVSVKRILNVPKQGSATPASTSSTATRRPRGTGSSMRCATPTTPASADRRYAASPRSSPCSTRSPPDSPTTPSDRRTPPGGARGPGYRAELEAEDTVEAHGRLENLDELIGSAHEFTRVDEFLEQVSLVADTDELPDGAIEDQVVLLTLHSAKGLEFPVVFLVGAEEGVFPSSRALSEPDDMEEERRLAYVGITGAQPPVHLPRGAAASTAPPPTTRRRGSSRRSPRSLVDAQGNVSGRTSYGRQSLRGRHLAGDLGALPPFRRGARRHDDRVGTDRSDAHRTGRRGGDRRWPAQRP